MTLRLKAKRVRYHSELSENLPRKFGNLWETPQRFQMSLTSWDIAAPLLLRAVKNHPKSFIKVCSTFNFSSIQCSTDLVDTDLVENFDLIDNFKKLQRPICGSLALQKLDLVENIAVTIFSSKLVVNCN